MSPQLEEENNQKNTNLFNQSQSAASSQYDANAVQRIAFTADTESGEVVYVFNPLTDERYAEFSRQSKTKIVDEGMSISIENTQALVDLFNDLASDVEGIPGEKPQNWKDYLDDYREKIPAVTSLLTVAAYSPDRVWGAGEPVVHTEAYFNGKAVKQTHHLRKKTVEDVKAERRFRKVPLAAKSKGLESNEITLSKYAIEKGELYDRMKEKEAEGYAGGAVPLWHKEAVIDHVFSAGVNQKK